MDAGILREAMETAISDLQELLQRLAADPETWGTSPQFVERVQDVALSLSDSVDPDGPLGGRD